MYTICSVWYNFHNTPSIKIIIPWNTLFYEGTFYAIIEIKTQDKKTIKIDARPSDAIAVSVRVSASIFVSENVMAKAKMVNAEKDEEETRNFKSFIDNINPDDFQEYLDKKN